ncbi:hypothetical protein QTP88_021502 [Uroleucon formosanum]
MFTQMQDEDIIRRRLSRSNNTLLSPLTISSWWSQKAVLRSDWRPSRKKSATSRNNSTVTSYRRPVTFDWLPVTPDQISLTAALVSAWPMVFATVYGPLELSLATGRGAQFPEVELSDLFHDILQRSLAPYARASEHSSLPYKPTRVSGPTDGLCRRQD